MSNTNQSFEQSLSQLTEIVNKMSGNQTSLEESLKLFENGIGLVNECRQQLTEAEKKVQMLINQNNNGMGDLQNVAIENNKVTPINNYQQGIANNINPTQAY